MTAGSTNPETDSSVPSDEQLAAALQQWMPAQRWFAAKGHTVTGVRISSRTVLAPGDHTGPRVEHLLVSVDADGVPTATYQVPVGMRADVTGDLARAALPELPDSPTARVYDGLRDPAVIEVYARAVGAGSEIGPLRFRGVDGDEPVDVGTGARVLGAEQSNTSVILGEVLLLKVFRRVSPGVSPDLELHLALGRAECAAIAPVRSWLEADLDGTPSTLAMAQDFARNVADGWEMALTSVRDLFAEADLHAEEVGTDFAGEATRIGGAVAEVHACLAAELGESRRTSADALREGMRARIAEAVAVVPQLAELQEALHDLVDAAAAEVEAGDASGVQRVHGDLHLGQVLRVPAGWLVIDFEGEPSTPLAARREPDSPLRDIAGIIRSFDYAAHQQLLEGGGEPSPQLAFRAREWAARNVEAFCAGYAEAAGYDPRSQAALLQAYVVDKAVYECVYEARNRPHWLDIPLDAIRRVAGGPHRRAANPVPLSPGPEEDR